MLSISALGLGLANYLKKNSTNLQSSELDREIDTDTRVINQQIDLDLKQAIYLNPSCADNPKNAEATIACSEIKVRGGITPLPGKNRDDLNALTNFRVPSNISDAPGDLPLESDAVRIVQFDFDSEFDCALYKDRPSDDNPAMASEKIYFNGNCEDSLSVGQVYVLVDQEPGTNTSTFSSLFQITDLTAVGGSPAQYVDVDIASSDNRFNQVGGLGISGYTSQARIFPVKIIEYAVDTAGATGLYRREFSPNENDFVGAGNWISLHKQIESIQFYPVTVSTSATVHNRTMSFDSSDTLNDSVEDIRGLSTRYVIKSRNEQTNGEGVDNPMTALVENDRHLRKEVKFFSELRNFSN